MCYCDICMNYTVSNVIANVRSAGGSTGQPEFAFKLQTPPLGF